MCFSKPKFTTFAKSKNCKKEMNHIQWEYEQEWDPTVTCA